MTNTLVNLENEVVTLKMIRETAKMTQKAMADKLDVSESYYQKIEGGFKSPSFNFITKFKESFPEITTDIFFNL